MSEAIAFQTRARTIDHLGREQIADVPTAVSELWKNAYDAYAREVSLHIFEGHRPTALIVDDGHGMSRDQFISKWLVVGTESKAGNDLIESRWRRGLPIRPKQGQKGIGRLSVAALGSQVLLITKQEDSGFVACLLDWRLFENPYLFLQDVRLPVVEFKNTDELPNALHGMREAILENMTGADGPADRTARLQSAWKMFDDVEATTAGETKNTSQQISEDTQQAFIDLDCLKYWSAWTGDQPCGTALIIAKINPALAAWVTDDADSPEAAQSVRASLTRTLTGFFDPYAEQNVGAMDYAVFVHSSEETRKVVGLEAGFGVDFLRSLDHCLEGTFDEYGIFRGTVRAFGHDLGEIELTPAQRPPVGTRDKLGPFSLCIGAFEPLQNLSTLAPDVHRKIVERAETHSGLSITRDGLRVMPYGRPENDFFNIEERRQSHAGREFWANRRLFGRIAISRQRNPNLRDKAGREGLIDNSASRALKLLVIDLLRTTARRYFGGDSKVRAELLPAIEAENEKASIAAKRARSGQLNFFRKLVRDQSNTLESALNQLTTVRESLDLAVSSKAADAIWQLRADIDALSSLKGDLRLPPKPKNLGSFEERYRQYRDGYVSLAEGVDAVRSTWSSKVESLQAKPAIETAKSRLGSNQKTLTDRLVKWKRAITGMLQGEITRIENQIDSDLKEFYKCAAPLLDDVEHGRSALSAVLDEMDLIKDRLDRQFSDGYDPYARSVKQLSEGIDLDSAFAFAGAWGETMERRLEQVQELAQIGISVEILSHELHSLDNRLKASLDALPDVAKKSDAFVRADSVRNELVERLRFLSQMQVSGGDARRRISGLDIYQYLLAFLGTILTERGIALKPTDEFLAAALFEFPSRIYPVFINLVNNSAYWVSKCAEKIICLSATERSMIVSDTGPGIDQDDIEHLFELFFSRRVHGRGVGLYLCRQTLAAGGHRIEYLDSKTQKVLYGANFAITFRNGFDA